MKSREFTEDEIRQQFLDHVRVLVNYWDKEVSEHTQTERLSGLAFSILTTIDGYSTGLPAFILAPCPHEDDKQFCINNEENYYPENHESRVKCDIAGELHELFYNAR